MALFPPMHQHLLLVVTDEETGAFLRTLSDSIHIFVSLQDLPESYDFESPNYLKLMLARGLVLVDILEVALNQSKTVIWLEPDFYYTQNLLNRPEMTDTVSDMVFYMDHDMYCGCFVRFAPVPASLRFYKEVMTRMQRIHSEGGSTNDQILLNAVIADQLPNFTVFDRCLYRSGTFNTGGFMFAYQLACSGVNPVAQHHNWIVGSESKVQMAKAVGGWFLAESGACAGRDMLLVVMTMNRPNSLRRLIASLQNAEYPPGGSVDVRVTVDRAFDGSVDSETVSYLDTVEWKHGVFEAVVWPEKVGLFGQWVDSWKAEQYPPGLYRAVVFLEDDLEVSLFFDKWFLGAHEAYGNLSGVGAITGQRPNLVAAENGPTSLTKNIPARVKAFGYLLMTTWSFSPKESVWRDFRQWVADKKSKTPEFVPSVPGIIMTRWYEHFRSRGEEENMWEMWFIRFAYERGLHTVYPWLEAGNKTLVGNWMESGLHFSGKPILDFPLAGVWDEGLLSQLPLPLVGYDLKFPENFWDFTAPFDVVVVGSGLSGAVIAERFASVLRKRVLVVEKRDHIGGNCYDYEDPDTGIRVSKYGAHLFHTNNEEVWNYIRKFGHWKKWEHRVLGYVNSKHVPIPVNIDTVNSLFNLTLKDSDDMRHWLKKQQVDFGRPPRNSEEMALSRVGRDLYEMIFKPYTEKQWNTTVSSLGPEVTGRIPIRDNFDDRYFSDKYQALPSNGYTSFFLEMIGDNSLIEIYTGTDYFEMSSQLKSRILPSTKIFFTGPIDRFFVSQKRLQYRSLKFSRVVVSDQKGFHLPAPVVNFPSSEFPYTRVVEYKHMLNQASGSTVLFYEFPSEEGEPYYPIPTEENKMLYRQLINKAREIPQVVFVGRLANYKYFNMDEAIDNALKVFRENCCDPAADIHVVTNVFNEDLSWVKEVCNLLKAKTVRWFIFNKNETSNLDIPGWINDHSSISCITLGWHHTHLPNVGREGHSWLTYIQNGVFSKTNIFFQGRPEGDLKIMVDAAIQHSNADGTPERVVPIFSSKFCRPNDDIYFDMDFFHQELIKLTSYLGVSLESMCYFYRGQFIASKSALDRVRTQHAEFIGNVLMPSLESGNDPAIGHALERSWFSLLSA